MEKLEERISLIIMLIALIGYEFNTILGMTFLIIISISFLIIKKSIKYTVPCAIYFIFTINKGFYNNKAPIYLIILGIIFLFSLIIFTIKCKPRLDKSIIPFILISITNFLPIFWCKNSYPLFYFLFFSGFLSLLIYFIFFNCIKKNETNILSISMSYLGIMLFLECLIYVIINKAPDKNIFEMWYYLGWGLCNEAGIIMCLCIPFCYYLLIKNNNLKNYILQSIKILLIIIGILLTTSRGAYIFGLIEIVILTYYIYYKNYNNKLLKKFILISIIIFSINILIFYKFFNNMINDISQYVFELNLSSNGRIKLWVRGLENWTKSPLSIIFGPGIISDIDVLYTANSYQIAPIVYHSTIIEVLNAGGLFGLISLIIHAAFKYKAVFRKNCLLTIILIGYVIIDLYGLIDNTFYMYYYMILISIIMALINKNELQ